MTELSKCSFSYQIPSTYIYTVLSTTVLKSTLCTMHLYPNLDFCCNCFSPNLWLKNKLTVACPSWVVVLVTLSLTSYTANRTCVLESSPSDFLKLTVERKFGLLVLWKENNMLIWAFRHVERMNEWWTVNKGVLGVKFLSLVTLCQNYISKSMYKEYA